MEPSNHSSRQCAALKWIENLYRGHTNGLRIQGSFLVHLARKVKSEMPLVRAQVSPPRANPKSWTSPSSVSLHAPACRFLALHVHSHSPMPFNWRYSECKRVHVDCTETEDPRRPLGILKRLRIDLVCTLKWLTAHGLHKKNTRLHKNAQERYMERCAFTENKKAPGRLTTMGESECKCSTRKRLAGA